MKKCLVCASVEDDAAPTCLRCGNADFEHAAHGSHDDDESPKPSTKRRSPDKG